MNVLQRHSIFFHVLSLSFIFFHFLSSFLSIFFRSVSFIFHFFKFLSFSFIFFHFLSFCRVLKICFFLGLNFVTISRDSPFEKINFLGPSRGSPFGPSFPFFVLLFFLPFFFFFFLALPVVYQLVTIWFSVKIRLRVVKGGRRVGQVLPSYQNFQISAFDETADAPQSCLFSFLSLSLHLSSVSVLRILIFLLTKTCPRGPLAGRSRVFAGRLPFFLWNGCTF